MDWKVFGTVFTTVFLAEIGDKTQLATMLYAADVQRSRWTVFLGSASALVVAAAIGVAAGALVGKAVSPHVLKWAAGLGFIAMGLWTIVRA
ncbi:MAG: TMEM165/GDT1 family protein [Planctomycetota bacterium]|nr:TMEM165/GDT1 family protein [Planctomycetota bacterium]